MSSRPKFQLATAKVHFIGIGGIGMCGLAELLHNMGATVTGSDANENLQTQRLESLGIKISKGHHAENIGDSEVVVYSSAVKPQNVEFQSAMKKQIPLIRRAEALAEMMRLKRGIAVAGTHGKTTTTSLCASIFLAAKFDPTIVVGGRLDVIQSTALLGQGEWLVAEADESDGSFSRLSPEIVIITNIDNDHLDHYGTFARLEEAFVDFAHRIPFYGVAVVCGDDPVIRRLFNEFPKRVLFYGFDEKNDFVLKPQTDMNGAITNYEILKEGKCLVQFNSALPGRHNALNACAAIVVAHEAGIEYSISAQAINSFRGVDRRFQYKANIRGISFFDDYGHHPTEVKAVLSGFKERFPKNRLMVIFQPHRYSRTEICWDQFKDCFAAADKLFLLDIYPAGEAPIEGIHSQRLAREISAPTTQFIDRKTDPTLQEVVRELKEGDIVLTLGAGDVVKLGERMMDSLAKS